MANGDDSIIHWVQSGAITLLGIFAGLVKWNWDKLNAELDKKANKQEMTDTLEALRQDFQRWQDNSDRWRADQDVKHTENRQRLDAILMTIGKVRR